LGKKHNSLGKRGWQAPRTPSWEHFRSGEEGWRPKRRDPYEYWVEVRAQLTKIRDKLTMRVENQHLSTLSYSQREEKRKGDQGEALFRTFK